MTHNSYRWIEFEVGMWQFLSDITIILYYNKVVTVIVYRYIYVYTSILHYLYIYILHCIIHLPTYCIILCTFMLCKSVRVHSTTCTSIYRAICISVYCTICTSLHHTALCKSTANVFHIFLDQNANKDHLETRLGHTMCNSTGFLIYFSGVMVQRFDILLFLWLCCRITSQGINMYTKRWPCQLGPPVPNKLKYMLAANSFRPKRKVMFFRPKHEIVFKDFSLG